MPRVARIVAPNYPHHITQRGNRGAEIFLTDEDRRTYIRLLKFYSNRHGLKIWAYCLMPNHIHLIAVPQNETSLSEALRGAHTTYALHFNQKARLSGHLWQGRFYSCPMDDEHLWHAVRYVEQNPVRAGLVVHAEMFEWSSARAHCKSMADDVLDPTFPPKGIIEDWGKWLRMSEDVPVVERIKSRTHSGRPCGGPKFVARADRGQTTNLFTHKDITR